MVTLCPKGLSDCILNLTNSRLEMTVTAKVQAKAPEVLGDQFGIYSLEEVKYISVLGIARFLIGIEVIGTVCTIPIANFCTDKQKRIINYT